MVVASLALAASAACHHTFNAHKSCCDVGATLKFFPVFNHIPDVVCPAVAFPLTAQYISVHHVFVGETAQLFELVPDVPHVGAIAAVGAETVFAAVTAG